MDSTPLPAGLEQLPSWHVDGAVLDLVELNVAGLVRAGFPARGDLDAALLPVSLPVPEPVADAVRAAGRAVLEDAEGVPVALVEVTDVWQGPGPGLLAAGPVTALKPLTHGAFRRSRLAPSQVRAAWGHAPSLLVATAAPLSSDAVLQLTEKAGAEPVLVLALVGAGRRPYPGAVGLVQALRASLADLPPGSLVVPVPVPRLADPDRDDRLVDAVARAYGAADVIVEAVGDPDAFDHAAATGELFAPAVLEVLRAHRPPPGRRGAVLFFSGLSGSGKSTVARGVEEALLESGGRTVTFLDGDVVRRHLSKGLGFSRADRDLNVRRIGFVAAEVARHGGIAICAPIAPYAATRAAVRSMVDDAGGVFLLVHVATPIEVCEARDRKGLYALARAGKIPEFTGVSDPYEVPDDADLRLDTSVQDVDSAVDAVLGLLTAAGLLPAARREGD
jgi:sulfate adenylyltransferase